MRRYTRYTPILAVGVAISSLFMLGQISISRRTETARAFTMTGAATMSVDTGRGNVCIWTIPNTRFGDDTTQFDITNPAGNTFRYTWDETGTDPGINSSTITAGVTVLAISGDNFTAANNGTFTVTAAGPNFFEVSNTTPGVAEENKTLGATGYLETGGSDETINFTGTPVAGQTMTLIVTDDDDAGNVARTLTLGDPIGWSSTGDTVTLTDGATMTLHFMYNGTIWLQVGTGSESDDDD